MAAKTNRTRPITCKLKHHGLLLGLMDADQFGQKVDELIPNNETTKEAANGSMAKIALLRLLSGDMPGGLNTIDDFALSLPANFISASDDNNDGTPYDYVNSTQLSNMLDSIADYGASKFASDMLACELTKESVKTVYINASSYHFNDLVQDSLVEITKENTLKQGKQASSDAKDKALIAQPMNVANDHDGDSRSAVSQLNYLVFGTKVEGVEYAFMLHQAEFDLNSNENARFQEFCTSGELQYLKSTYQNLKTMVVPLDMANATTAKSCADCGIELITRLSDTQVKKDFVGKSAANIQFSSVEVPVLDLEGEKSNAKPQAVKYSWLGTQELKAKDGSTFQVQKVLFVAEQLRDKKAATIKRKAEKELKDFEAELTKLQANPRSCLKDAMRDFSKLTKKLKYVVVSEPTYEELSDCSQAGKSKSESQDKLMVVKVYAEARLDLNAVNEAIERELYYVIATTNLSTKCNKESALNLYQAYHGQLDSDYRWKDLKALGTFCDAVYFKTEDRIRALLALITIALFYQIRLMTYVRQVLSKHKLSLSLKNEPKCDRPILKSFITFASSELDDTSMLVSSDDVWMPDFDGSIIYLIAQYIGAEAVKYYSEDFYQDDAEYIYSSLIKRRQMLR